MEIKTRTKSEAFELLRMIKIYPYEKYIDIKITYPNGYYGIFNERGTDNQFIPYSFKYTNNGKIFLK